MTKRKLFQLGQLSITASVANQVEQSVNFYRFVFFCISRHQTGDWGNSYSQDKDRNEYALVERARIFSSYNVPTYCGLKMVDKVWIITEADRSYTTVLFPGDY